VAAWPPRQTVDGVDALSLERQVCFALAIMNRAMLAVNRHTSAAD
jgi:hypothetical protein